jgi:hypothetical protein
MKTIGCWLVVAVLTLFASSGCGDSTVQVEGTVSYEGQPIKAGAIAFVSMTDKGKSAGGAIVDGKYTIPAEFGPKTGKYKVEIRWAKPTGQQFKSESGEMLDMTVEGLPEKYHSKSTLEADLKSGKNVVDFNLEK